MHSRGFTLLEMIIATGVFSAVIVIAASVVVVLNSAQKKAINIQNTHDNIRFALESISREIRTSDKYCKLSGCSLGGVASVCTWASGGCDSVVFRQVIGASDIRYRLYNGVVEKRLGTGQFFPVTDPRRTVTSLRFYISGLQPNGDPSDTEQQKVTIIMEVMSDFLTTGKESARLHFQTTVTKRKLF